MLSTMRLEPTTRQRLQLLLQRQHIEEEELRLRHFMELEKFRERELMIYFKIILILIQHPRYRNCRRRPKNNLISNYYY